MDNDLYIWKRNFYDLLCRNLTDYENGEYENLNWANEFYDLLTDVVNNWDIISREV